MAHMDNRLPLSRMSLSLQPPVRFLQRAFVGFDRTLRNHDADTAEYLAPIFAIGCPRSGSTLLMQLVVAQCQVAHLSNMTALLPRYMLRLCRWYRRCCAGWRHPARSSQFGVVAGICAPSEAGPVMRHWFDAPGDPEHDRLVRATVAALTRITSAPLFVKNQVNTTRLAAIRRIFPEARLLLLLRDPRFTAQSLLLGRRALSADDKLWWSAKPPGWEDVQAREPLYQVLWQVDQVEEIGVSACLAQRDRALVADYARLCATPGEVMDAIALRFNLRRLKTVPEAQSAARQVRLPPQEWARLEQLYADGFASKAAARRSRCSAAGIYLGHNIGVDTLSSDVT